MANDIKKNNNNRSVFLSMKIQFVLLNNIEINIVEINNIDKLIAKLPNSIDIGNTKNK